MNSLTGKQNDIVSIVIMNVWGSEWQSEWVRWGQTKSWKFSASILIISLMLMKITYAKVSEGYKVLSRQIHWTNWLFCILLCFLISDHLFSLWIDFAILHVDVAECRINLIYLFSVIFDMWRVFNKSGSSSFPYIGAMCYDTAQWSFFLFL